MVKQDRIEKCKSVIGVLEKIIDGVAVTYTERLNACKDAIEVLCRNNSKKSRRKIE